MPDSAVSATGSAVAVETIGGAAESGGGAASEGVETETVAVAEVGRFEAGPLAEHAASAATAGRSRRAVTAGFVLIAE